MQFGVGLEGVNIPYASEKGIMVANIPGELCGNAQSCAEHAIFLALGLLRNINSIPHSIKLQKLGSPIGKTLFKSTVLIYGFGSIGKELFRRVVNFSPSEVIIIQKNSNPDSLAEFSAMDFTSLRVKVLSHEEFQQMKDHELLTEQIFICCTQNKDNLGFVNKSFLKKFRNSVNIINIARVSS
jgi:lactate dehydrogenase-like 2-hydroxyacid dehydrogenase